MACSSGGGESHDSVLFLTDHLLQSPIVESHALTVTQASSSSSTVVLSPMNSNFTSLCSPDILRSILELLPPADLSRAACVCRLWRDVASVREMQEKAFRRPWNVGRVVGVPSSSTFWRHPGLDRFAISHGLRRGDTIPGLAIKYSVQVVDIKRLNNMMSEHGIYSRERLLIPISSSKLGILSDSTCYIELDAHAKREVAVLYLDEDGRLQAPSPTAATPTTAAAEEGRGRSRILIESVKRSMNVDDGTAEYYLSASNGDPRAAIMHLSEDLSWEHQRAARQ